MTMEITYERGINGTYMILPGQSDMDVGYAKRMILENPIRGFLPIAQRCHEDGTSYEYKVSSLISMAEYLEHHPLRSTVLKQWIFTFCQAVTEMEEYLLTEEYLWLSPETVFLQGSETDPFHGNFYFCLYPDIRQDTKEDLRQLVKYLMERTDPADEVCARMCYELYDLVQKDNFCLREYMETLERWATLPQPNQVEKKKEKKKRPKQLFASGRNGGIIKQ